MSNNARVLENQNCHSNDEIIKLQSVINYETALYDISLIWR
jgi:hypothetical protein